LSPSNSACKGYAIVPSPPVSVAWRLRWTRTQVMAYIAHKTGCTPASDWMMREESSAWQSHPARMRQFVVELVWELVARDEDALLDKLEEYMCVVGAMTVWTTVTE
jgi:hypothetical protein